MDFELVYLSLGSNVGDKFLNFEKAIHEICLITGPLVHSSSLYETEPWGTENQDVFLNQVIAVKTKHEPGRFMEYLLDIENKLGRIRTIRNAPRIIDIDILLFGNQIINKKDITIPHPRMHVRKFILIPMNEIAPELIHPVLNLSMNELLTKCDDNSFVKKLRPHEIKSE